jgi:carbamoyltransferase
MPEGISTASAACSARSANWRGVIPAVVHANGTARVQTLTTGQNPFLAEVLQRFADLTGIPLLINTSLNVKGKPICGTPQMALAVCCCPRLRPISTSCRWRTRAAT